MPSLGGQRKGIEPKGSGATHLGGHAVTLLRWHHELIARKWDYSHKRRSVGRPQIRQETVDLAVRIAQENTTWGYDRIQGALGNVGFHSSNTTVANILEAHGIEPDPQLRARGPITYSKSTSQGV